MDKKRPAPYDEQDDRELFDDIYTVASATECTGLIPAAPINENAVDSYSEIYDVPLAGNASSAVHHFQNADDKKKRGD